MSKYRIATTRLLQKLKLNSVAYNISKLFTGNQILEMDYDSARNLLSEYSPKPDGTTDGKNNIHEYKYDLQINVAVYNNQEYTRKCMETLANQKTKYSYICYVVDDGSKDDSYHIVDEFKDHPNFVIIHQDNKGLPGSRNTGLKDICARYVMLMDGDDYLSEDAVEKLMDYAIENDADIVDGSYISVVNDRYIYCQSSQGPCDYLSLSGFAWMKVIRSEIFENIRFPENYWFEDTTMSFLVYPLAKKIYRISDYIYYHNLNKKGLVSIAKGARKSVDTYWISELLNQRRIKDNYPVDMNYWNLLKRQFAMNYKRIYLLPEDVKKAVFILEKELLKEVFPNRMNDDEFMSYIYDGNYQRYNLYAYWNYL